MKEIEYKVLGVDDLELLVKIRIKDLKMFSNQKITIFLQIYHLFLVVF